MSQYGEASFNGCGGGICSIPKMIKSQNLFVYRDVLKFVKKSISTQCELHGLEWKRDSALCVLMDSLHGNPIFCRSGFRCGKTYYGSWGDYRFFSIVTLANFNLIYGHVPSIQRRVLTLQVFINKETKWYQIKIILKLFSFSLKWKQLLRVWINNKILRKKMTHLLRSRNLSL